MLRRSYEQLKAIFAKGRDRAKGSYAGQKASRVASNVRNIRSEAPAAGRHIVRTFSFGPHSADRGVAHIVNLMGIAAEHSLHGRIQSAAQNLTLEGARTIGLAQKHATAAALDRLHGIRKGVARRTGGPLDAAEAEKVAKTRREILTAIGALGDKRELRRKHDARIDVAAAALAARMRAAGLGTELSHGITNEDMTRDTIARFVGGDNYAKHRNDVVARAIYMAKFGGR